MSQELGPGGITAKRTAGTYLPGKPARSWVTVNHGAHQGVLVTAWLHGKGGRVGTGFSDKDLRVPEDVRWERTMEA